MLSAAEVSNGAWCEPIAPSALPQPQVPTGTIAFVATEPDAQPRPLTVLLYSSDADCRVAVQAALGRRPAPELPRVEYVEMATEPMVTRRMSQGGIDLVILDGEATPAGGMGMCRAMKDEVFRCPPVLVLTGRPQDAWLATWSRADAVVPHPLDPAVLTEAVATLLRGRVAVSTT